MKIVNTATFILVIDEWEDGWMDGCLDSQMNKWTNEQMGKKYALMDR